MTDNNNSANPLARIADALESIDQTLKNLERDVSSPVPWNVEVR